MKLISFRTPKPKSFNYTPRYYDPEKEKLERRKAELGLDSELSHNEQLKLRMSRRWGRNVQKDERSPLSKLVSYLVYATIVVGSIYFILFTDVIENMLRAFGVTN